MDNNLGLSHFWEQADPVSHGVAYILLLLSILSWYFIFGKAWLSWQVRRTSQRSLQNFWDAPSMPQALQALHAADSDGIFYPLAQQASAASAQAAQHGQHGGSLNAQVDPSELLTRSLRQAINRAAARLESGQTLLASVGSTAPFIGLFGTVWGIYHALLSIAGSGQILIDKVAGPVGEALIMTAAGLAVAIPAVLAYNAFTRVNRLILADLDGFAHDLHAFYTTGQRLQASTAPSSTMDPQLDRPAKIGS